MSVSDDKIHPEPEPRRRGRPPGSKNKPKDTPSPAAEAPAKRQPRKPRAQVENKPETATPKPQPKKERIAIKHESFDQGENNKREEGGQRQRHWQKNRKGKQAFNKGPRDKRDNRDHRDYRDNRGGDRPQGERQQGKNQQKFQKNKPQREPSRERAYVPIGEPEEHSGLLIITPKNYGFVRPLGGTATPEEGAVYVPADLIAQYHLRPHVQITGMAQKFERGHQMISITEVNGMPPEAAAALPHFDELKAVNPSHRLAFETEPSRYTTRTLDLVAPVARGQRGLIVAPPRTGKTTLLMHIAEAVQENYSEDMHLMILLVDERPEEVTEFKRSLPGAEVYASSNDSKVREHCQTAEMCIERAKRLVEGGKHVLLLLDSITRLARAYNNDQRGSGRTMSGGIDARALEIPRRLFAAARNTRTAGSLTILATALIETNSRMDDLIFQEFKGTGNMELVLNRRIAEMYIYPAVDILKSGTRREELILAEMSLEKIRLIRRALAGHKPVEAMERLLFFLRKYKSNAQMLLDLKSR
ncbi:MAG: transcription termination factor Rho [Akkermansia sp.]